MAAPLKTPLEADLLRSNRAVNWLGPAHHEGRLALACNYVGKCICYDRLWSAQIRCGHEEYVMLNSVHLEMSVLIILQQGAIRPDTRRRIAIMGPTCCLAFLKVQ